jgi:cytochrome c peroxidase
MKRLLILSTAIAMVFSACTGNKQQPAQQNVPDELQTKAKSLFGVLPKEASSPDNAITPEKVLLGKTLFYDTRLSTKGNNSCNSCHNLATYGVDNQSFSTGDDGKKGGRNSPTVLNAALSFVQFWDGRSPNVEDQAGGPIMNPVEMNMHSKEDLEKMLAGIDGYKSMFTAAFPDDPNPVTFQHVQMAIAAFERTLLTPSKFDTYLEGNTEALAEQEKRGMETFIEVGCTACHTGVLLGGNMYQKFGLFKPYHELTGSEKIDPGRAEVTKNGADSLMFKVPTLRNIEKTFPYFHDGSVADLEKAIKIMGMAQLNKEITDQQAKDIAVFLSSLTGQVPAEAQQAPPMP